MTKSRKPRAVACDCETSGSQLFHGCQPFFVSMCDDQGNTWQWEWDVDPYTRKVRIEHPSDLEDISDVLAKYDRIVFHNAKFDLRALEQLTGYPIHFAATGQIWERVHDTLLMSHVLYSGEDHGLKSLAVQYLDMLDDDEKTLGDAVKKARHQAKKLGWKIADKSWVPGSKSGQELWKWDYWLPRAVDPSCDLLSRYGCNDVIRTMRLYLLFQKELADRGLEAQYERERQLQPIVYRMESDGIPIKTRTLLMERRRYELDLDAAERKLIRLANGYGIRSFNFRSPIQLRSLLYDKLGLTPPKQTAKGQDSTDADTFKQLLENNPASQATPILVASLAFRFNTSAINYLDGYNSLACRKFDLNQDLSSTPYRRFWHCLHPSFNQTGTGTTRFSCSTPNAQNVSKKAEMPLRSCFGPRKGTFWYDLDYKNLELRIMAYAAQEASLIEAFQAGRNVNREIAGEMWDMDPADVPEDKYKQTKNFIYATFYGAGERRADATLGLAGGYEKFKGRYQLITDFTEKLINQARKVGSIKTMFGYELQVPKDRPYAAMDYYIQGTAGDVLKYGMINLWNLFQTIEPSQRPKLIMTVHDELVIEVLKELRSDEQLLSQIVKAMEEPGTRIGIPTPVEVETVICKWSERKPVSMERIGV